MPTQVLQLNVANDIVKALAFGPKRQARRWDHYYINGYNFHTYDYGKSKSTMNYGVCVKGTDGMEYYGILKDVVELYYVGDTRGYKTVLFKCDWYDNVNGVVVHDTYKLVDVNHTKRYPKYDPFVLASQAIQVCYIPYPAQDSNKKDWWAVLKMRPRPVIDAPEDDIPFQVEENEDPPSLGDMDIADDAEIVQEQDEELDDNEDDELDNDDTAYGADEFEGPQAEEPDDIYDSDDDYFSDSPLIWMCYVALLHSLSLLCMNAIIHSL